MSEEPREQAELEDETRALEEEADDEIIGRAFRLSLLVLAAAAALAAVVWLLVRSGGDSALEQEIAAPAPQAVATDGGGGPPAVRFTDITSAAGIAFVHESGARGDRFLPETMGAGGAFLDYDADGDYDLLLVNSDTWEHALDGGPAGPRSALYENDGSGSFRDVSESTGLDVALYGTAVAVGDYDNDSYPDVFLAAVGRNRLLHNRPAAAGGRRFVDVTEAAGVGGDESEWSSSSTFFDYDNDGDLDLFVCNYVRWSRQIDLEINHTLVGVGRAYGPPFQYQGTFPYLYRNDGGVFADVSAESGVQVRNSATGTPVAKALGVTVIDPDGDGWMDLVVANDTVRNFFFHNLGDGSFEEAGELFGVAYGRDGAATGAMGIDAGSYRNDGELGLVIGNFANEMSSLYVSQADPTLYADEAIGAGVGAPSRRALSFGVFFFDYDLDGRLDLLQVNGHLENEIHRVDPSQQYRQKPQLFWNAGPDAARSFVEVDLATAGDLDQELVGRGSAYSDIDADGDLDVLLLQTGDRAVLLRNDQELGHHWLRVRLLGNGRTSNRDAIGAVVRLEAGGVAQERLVSRTRSYQSQSEPVVTFGLGDADQVDALVIRWPDGAEQEVRVESVDGLLRVEQEAP